MIDSGLLKVVLGRHIRMPFFACGQYCADQATGVVRVQMQHVVACSVTIMADFVRSTCRFACVAQVILQ